VPRRPISVLSLALIGACGGTPPDDSPKWVRVARDANYTIYLDTSRIRIHDVRRGVGASYSVWYRTDHAQPRVNTKSEDVFNRELVHSVIRCRDFKFRVASVDMSMGDGKVVVRQRLTEKELADQEWRSVELGTAEELAARAACHFVTADARVPPAP
jgi:hypothetical protein